MGLYQPLCMGDLPLVPVGSKHLTTYSPLRYPGGKSYLRKEILNHIPPDIEYLCSPFFGGGSVELSIAARGFKVYAYDIFEPVVNFWDFIINMKEQMVHTFRQMHPISLVELKKLTKEYFGLEDKSLQAILIFIGSIKSFRNLGLFRGVFDFPMYMIRESHIKEIENFHSGGMISIKEQNFVESINSHPNAFLFLDPPYWGNPIPYGKLNKSEFDHMELYNIIKDRSDWLLTYNNVPEIRSLYKAHKILEIQSKSHMSAKNVSGTQIMILSKEG